jgi:hypothetical protein
MLKPKAYVVDYLDNVRASHMDLLNRGNGGELIISCGDLRSPLPLILNKINPRE